MPTGNLENQTPVSPQQWSRERKTEYDMNKISTHCENNNNTSYFASTRLKKKTPSCCCPKHNNDGDPISLSQRHTIKTPTSVFPHAGFLLRVARVTEPKGVQSLWQRKREWEVEKEKRRGKGWARGDEGSPWRSEAQRGEMYDSEGRCWVWGMLLLS